MRTIWKFGPIRAGINHLDSVPAGAELLHVDWQRGGHEDEQTRVFIWALVDPKAEYVDRRVRLVGTGHVAIDPEAVGEHVGTFLDPDRLHAWHVFDLGEVRS